MAQHRDSARETILDAFQELLVETNGSGASLDEVARRAGVTKGGLLYHFGSRRILEGALIDRLERLAEVEYERMRTVPGGAAAYYVTLAEYINTPLDRATLAVGFLAKQDPRAREVTKTIRQVNFDILVGDLGDPALARATMLIADGMYFDATTIGEPFGQELDVVAFLKRMQAATASGTQP
jgi:AcrR family transcriptional regulator